MNPAVIQEPFLLDVFFFNILGVMALMALYFFGVWSRSYIFPADKSFSVRQQFVAAVPMALITMGFYAKSALPTLHGHNGVFDFTIMLGYAIFLGMVARETLEKMIAKVTGPAK